LALQNAGYDVHVAHSADVALSEALAHHPDAIILDFQMPFVNGVGFLYRLRANQTLARTPVLVVTGQSLSEEVRAELRELHAQIRLKPIGSAELVAATASLLGDHVPGDPSRIAGGRGRVSVQRPH
jgi:two-component system alkaline phosphatase synthesis response regulator PhoP